MRRRAEAILMALAVGLIAFLGGRRARGWFENRADAGQMATSAVAGEGHSAGRSAAVHASRMANLLGYLATRAAPPASHSQEEAVLATLAESSEIAEKRRVRVRGEIQQKAPGLPEAKRELILQESDRLALNKRQLRAAFLLGQISEDTYTEALRDDVRAAMAAYEEALTDDEFAALTARVKGKDPFSMESLAKRAPPERGGACDDAAQGK